MPTLNNLSCAIELGLQARIPLEEYQTRYTNGAVQTYIAVPLTDLPFHVRLTADGYIAPGLAAFVFIDGQYQCNRNRQRLTMDKYDMEMILRQKEDELPNGLFVAREWTFAKLQQGMWLSSDKETLKQTPNFVRNVGTIEVVILRCRPSESSRVSSPALEHSIARLNLNPTAGPVVQVSKLRSDEAQSGKAQSFKAASAKAMSNTAPPVKATPNKGASSIGLGALFDGAGDQPDFSAGCEANKEFESNDLAMPQLDGYDDRDGHHDRYGRPHGLGRLPNDLYGHPPNYMYGSGPAQPTVQQPGVNLADGHPSIHPFSRVREPPPAMQPRFEPYGYPYAQQTGHYHGHPSMQQYHPGYMQSPMPQNRVYGRYVDPGVMMELGEGGAWFQENSDTSSTTGTAAQKDRRRRSSRDQREQRRPEATKAASQSQSAQQHKAGGSGEHRPGDSKSHGSGRHKHNDGLRTTKEDASKQPADTASRSNQKGDTRSNHGNINGGSNKVEDWNAEKPDVEGNGTWNQPNEPKAEQNDGWLQPSEHQSQKSGGWGPTSEHKSSSKSAAGNTGVSRASGSTTSQPRIKPYWQNWNQPVNPPAITSRKPSGPRDPYVHPATAAPIRPAAESVDASYGVQTGRGVDYAHHVETPIYLDRMEKPYAVFSFRYRSQSALEDKLGRSIASACKGVVEAAEEAKLRGMRKDELVAELLQARRGGENGAVPGGDVTPADSVSQHGWAS